MPNIVNQILIAELEKDLKAMGSCIVLNFDKLTVELTEDFRNQMRAAGVQYKVVKNRLAIKAFANMGLDLSAAFSGKCGVVTADEEKAISAAKIVQEFALKARRALQIKTPPLWVTGGVIEGEAITGSAAANIADMPDKNTVRSMLLSAIQGPARGLAGCIQGLPAGLARVMQARIDKLE
jgi:ribosomal protein L10